MKWRVLLFAHHREKYGESIDIEADATVAGALRALGSLGLDVRSSRLAANNEFLSSEDPLPLGAELALIPPVSGG